MHTRAHMGPHWSVSTLLIHPSLASPCTTTIKAMGQIFHDRRILAAEAMQVSAESAESPTAQAMQPSVHPGVDH